MACFGFTDLAVVGERLPPESPAYRTGSAARGLLDAIAYFPTLEEALRGGPGESAGLALGFTRRPRLPGQTVLSLSEAVTVLSSGAAEAPVALVFGRESTGLLREETLLLDVLVTIPMAAETLSLNLSHAVTVVLQALHAGRPPAASGPALEEAGNSPAEPGSAHDEALAPEAAPTWAEGERLLQEWTRTLERNGFFRPGKEKAQRESLRLLFRRLAFHAREEEFLRGMLRHLSP